MSWYSVFYEWMYLKKERFTDTSLGDYDGNWKRNFT